MELPQLIKYYNRNPQYYYIIAVGIFNDFYYESYNKDDAYTRICITAYEKESIDMIRNVIINYQKADNIGFIEENGIREIIKEEYNKQAEELYAENDRICKEIKTLEQRIEELGGSIIMESVIYPKVKISEEWCKNVEYTDFIIKCFPSTLLYKEIERYQHIQKLI